MRKISDHNAEPKLPKHTDLTGKPGLQAGRELKRLADMLTRVHEPDAAVRWGEALNAWHGRWKRMLAERTYAKDNPDDPRAATSRGGWWWAHLPLRRAYFRLERLFKDGTLFCFLDPELTILGPVVLLQCLFSRLISIFPQCGRMVFPGLVIMQSVM